MSDTSTASETGRMTQAERRERSEQELLEATMRVVSEKGVAAATFDAIGREAGYSRGLVTQRFGSKDGLIRSLITGRAGRGAGDGDGWADGPLRLCRPALPHAGRA